MVHRLGVVPPTESSVAIAVSTPHRADAFAAGQWLIDSLKTDVPIWKREQWADGTSEWVHPGVEPEGEKGRGGERETRNSAAAESPSLPISHSPPL
jgi:molybdopterin synthase catalytic subunit